MHGCLHRQDRQCDPALHGSMKPSWYGRQTDLFAGFVSWVMRTCEEPLLSNFGEDSHCVLMSYTTIQDGVMQFHDEIICGSDAAYSVNGTAKHHTAIWHGVLGEVVFCQFPRGAQTA